jgi:hypothetical protein
MLTTAATTRLRPNSLATASTRRSKSAETPFSPYCGRLKFKAVEASLAPDMERPVKHHFALLQLYRYSFPVEQTEQRPRRPKRRLITLIFADRAHMPASRVFSVGSCLGLRTRVQAEALSHRGVEDSPFRRAPRPLPSLLQTRFISSCSLSSADFALH